MRLFNDGLALSLAVAAVVLMGVSTSANAALVIQNGSFELDDLSPNELRTLTERNAAPWFAQDSDQAANASSAQLISDGAILTGKGLSPTDGDQIIRLVEDAAGNVILGQDLGVIAQSDIDGLIFEFDISLENGPSVDQAPDFRVDFVLNLGTGSESTTSFTSIADPAISSFETRSINLSDIGATDGDTVRVNFIVSPLSDGETNILYLDNVTFTEVVPEPGSMSLMVLGLLIAGRRRAR